MISYCVCAARFSLCLMVLLGAHLKVKMLVSVMSLYDPMDGRLPGSSGPNTNLNVRFQFEWVILHSKPLSPW